MSSQQLQKKNYRKTMIAGLFLLGFFATLISLTRGSVPFTVRESLRALFFDDGSSARLLIWHVRLPRVLSGGLVGVCLSLSGCILQGVMRNHLASPSTIGVTSGASFVGYVTLVLFPGLYHLLPVGAILGAFLTTMGIYALAYERGVSPVKMILSGLAVSAVFGAFNDIIRSFYPERIVNVMGYLIGSLSGVSWSSFLMILPYALAGIFFTFLLPSRMNVLMLGDEVAGTLGLRPERFRFLLITVSSLLAGAAIAVGGLINFVGLIVPHIARLLVGSDYKYLFPASIGLGYTAVVICDLIGRTILPIGEISVSIILSFVGAPFFLYLLRKKKNSYL